MGLNASRLLAIDLLKRLHSGGKVVLTENDCFDNNGNFDDEMFQEYLIQEDGNKELMRKARIAMSYMVGQSVKRKREALAEAEREFMSAHKKSWVSRPIWYTDRVTGQRRKKTPKMSAWWSLYIEDPQPGNAAWAKEFRQNFRCPYASYVMILDMLTSDKSQGMFDRWQTANDTVYERVLNNKKNKNKKVSPVELLLLGSLRYLGRGWTFADMKDVTLISRDVHRKFFHQFVKFGAKVLYPLYVSAPCTEQELRDCEEDYAIAGFPGCIGSTDATHIPLEKVCFSLRQAHLGGKSKSTTRTYNLTCNHQRQILHTTTGHPGRWNDKTLVRFDSFMADLRDGAMNENMSFELRTRQGLTTASDEERAAGDKNERTLKLKGAYVIVDNGYLEWSTTVPPVKNSCDRAELRFSQWLESIRKDVECTFGILKGRWRILKTGIRVHNTKVCDNIWLTCCALHNMLLDVDGLNKRWKHGIRSRWEMGSGEFLHNEIPFAIHKLVDPTGTEEFRIRQYDGSRFGYQRPSPIVVTSDNEEEEDDDISDDEEGINGGSNRNRNGTINPLPCPIYSGRIESGTAVNQLNFFQFRSLLVENFNIRFHENNIQWPRRLAPSIPRNVPVLIPATNVY